MAHDLSIIKSLSKWHILDYYIQIATWFVHKYTIDLIINQDNNTWLFQRLRFIHYRHIHQATNQQCSDHNTTKGFSHAKWSFRASSSVNRSKGWSIPLWLIHNAAPQWAAIWVAPTPQTTTPQPTWQSNTTDSMFNHVLPTLIDIALYHNFLSITGESPTTSWDSSW